MAGSYNHIVTKTGNLASNERVVGMLENGGDVFEAVEEMYGMIWYLAGMHPGKEKMAVEEARQKYLDGLRIAKKINGGG